jgi:hypothetical protein
MLLIKNYLSAPKVLNISLVPKAFSSYRVLERCEGVDILPLLKFKKRIVESELRFTGEDQLAETVSRLYENASGEWQNLLSRQIFSQVKVGILKSVLLIISLSKWPDFFTEHPWVRKIPMTPPSAYLERLNLQGLDVWFRITE